MGAKVGTDFLKALPLKAFMHRQLTRRISDSPALGSQVQVLTLAQLESLGEALLDFTSSSDLAFWLSSHAA